MLIRPFPDYKELFCILGDHNFEYDEVLGRNEMHFDDLTINTELLCFAEQIHADGITYLNDESLANQEGTYPLVFPGADALVTDSKGIYIAIKYADCIPILIFDPVQKIIAGVHSGRTGTELNIAGKTIAGIRENYGSNSSDLIVVLGPSICGNHYEVSRDIFENFVASTDIDQTYPKLDLKRVVRHQLKSCDIDDENIHDYPICTFEDHRYYSYRRDNTLKRQISIIGMNNG